MTTLTIKPRRRRFNAEGERPSVLARVLAWIVMLFCLAYFFVPVLWLFIASTKSPGDLYTTPGFAFANPHFFDNVVALSTYDNGIFWRWMLNSGVYSVLGAVLTTIVSTLCGYALAMYRFIGRRVLMAAIAASLLVPATVLAPPTFVLLAQLGLNNSYIAVLLPGMVYPFGVMLAYLTASAAIPPQIIEAARLDGAGEFRTFFSVTWRLMSTGMTTILLFAFITSWNSFLLPLLVLNDQNLFPVTLGLNVWNQQSRSVAELGSLTVIGSFVSIIPIVLAFIGLQRFWRSGLASGGVRF